MPGHEGNSEGVGEFSRVLGLGPIGTGNDQVPRDSRMPWETGRLCASGVGVSLKVGAILFQLLEFLELLP